MKTFIQLFILVLVSTGLSAQKYTRSGEKYNFSFTKEGKMKVTMGANEIMTANLPKEFTAQNEIILYWEKWSGTWVSVLDGKVLDSIVKPSDLSDYYEASVCFIRRGDKLVFSEYFNATEDYLMEPDPETGEPMEVYDDYGNPIVNIIYSGGNFEIINLKDGKPLVKKSGECLTRIYGDKFLSILHVPSEDTYYDTYSLYESTGKNIFESKTLEEIYSDDNWLSQLVSQGKAEKILFKNMDQYYENFAFLQNGKMGYSSIAYGVKSEPQYEFVYPGYEMTFYLENNKMKGRGRITDFEAGKSILVYTTPMDYMVSVFIDGKIMDSGSEGDYGYWGTSVPSYTYTESFIKIGDLLIYSKPYIAPEEMYYESMWEYVPSEGELGLLLVYDLTKKQLIFNNYTYSLVNYTDRGILIRKASPATEEGFYGGIDYYYSILDLKGNYLHKDIIDSVFKQDPKYLLGLLPDGAKTINYNKIYSYNSLLYSLNGKIGLYSEASGESISPSLRWYLNSYGDNVKVTDKEVMDNFDTVSYSGNLPYLNKLLADGSKTYVIRGDKRTVMLGYSGEQPTTEKIEYKLTDTTYSFYSVELKNNLVVQNASSNISSYLETEFDDMSGESWNVQNDAGDFLYVPMYLALSGVYDRKAEKWIIPDNYYRIASSGNKFFASEYVFPKGLLTKAQFEKSVRNPVFSAFDETGNLIIKGTAAEVKKKTGTDPSTAVFKY